jgi:hypothetical protein
MTIQQYTRGILVCLFINTAALVSQEMPYPTGGYQDGAQGSGGTEKYQTPRPAISAEAHLDFGSVTLGSSAEKSLTVKNTGSDTLRMSAASIPSSDFSIVSGGGSQNIPVNGSVNVQVKFQPSLSGARLATLTVTSNAANAPSLDIALTGTGVMQTRPSLFLSSQSLDFGDVTIGANVKRRVTVRNNGNADLTVSAQTLAGTNASEFTVTHQNASALIKDDSDYIELQFNPATTGVKSALLRFTTNDSSNLTVSINLNGVGKPVSLPHITLSRGVIDFGNVPVLTSKDEDVTIRNDGAADLRLSNPSISGKDSLHFSIVQFPDSLIAANGQSLLRIRHLPLTTGSKSAKYVVTTNDPANSLVEILLGSVAVGVDREGSEAYGFALEQSYPNPLIPYQSTAMILFTIPSRAHVRLSVIDNLGKEVAVLVNEVKERGTHQTGFNAAFLPSGTYYYVLRSNMSTKVRNMVVVR